MIATIILGSLIAFFIVVMVVLTAKCGDDEGFKMTIPTALCAFVLFICLYAGYSVDYDDLYADQCLVYMKIAEYGFNEFTLDLATEHNKNVDRGNNLWCRFETEDRSWLKVEIDDFEYYIGEMLDSRFGE